MNVLIAADMEGIAGIEGYEGCLPSHPAAYARGRALMTEEVTAVAEALRESGAEGVGVGDWHMVGTNLVRDRLPAGTPVRPIADLALAEGAPSIAKANGGRRPDAVVLLGHHASTSTGAGFCSHTFVWGMEVELDGEPLSETQVYGQALAAEEIPVLAAAGDRHLLEALDEDELGGAALIATKEGRGRARADSASPAEVRAKLTEAVAAGISTLPAPPPPRAYPAELSVRLEGEELERVVVRGPAELLAAVARIFRTSPASRDYRRLARLLPSDDSAGAALRRRIGSFVATPAIRAKERRWLAAAG